MQARAWRPPLPPATSTVRRRPGRRRIRSTRWRTWPHMRLGSTPARTTREAGVTLLYVAVSMFPVLGMAALAVDLTTLYAARSDAQRAADAAALAPAQAFVVTGYTPDLSGGS